MTLILNGTDNSATTPAVTGTDTDTGVYYPAANQVALATNGTLALLVDASRNIGIGVTPSVSTLNGFIEGFYGSIGFTSGLGVSIAGNAYYDSNWKYKLASTATLQSQDSAGFKWFTAPTGTVGNAITFTQSLGLIHGSTLTLAGGTSSSGTGIAFPATQSASSDANTLDDYEEGTFTPVLNRDSSSPTVTYTDRQGKYTKVGNVVTVSISVVAASVSPTGSGNTTITGLPFANGSTTYTGQGAIGYNTAAVNTLSGSWIASTSVYFRSGTRSDGNDGGGWQTGYYDMSITYLV